MSDFSRLFSPVKIGALELKNRIAMAPMGTFLANKDGSVSEDLRAYFAARARGGTGLIMIGETVVDFPTGAGRKNLVLTYDDKYIPGLSSLAEAIHKHGARAMLQLNHFGPADQFDMTNLQPVAASAIARTPDFAHPDYWLPREMSVVEIKETVSRFAAAAGRAQQAGFDGVEIDAALRYLLNSFLSPRWNQRGDEYGGSLENRARFLMEVIRATRETVGPDYPVWCRINSEERGIEGGITFPMALELAGMLDGSGIDLIDVAMQPPHSPLFPPGFNLAETAAIKKAVAIPVMAGGRIDGPLAEKLLRESRSDLICIGRALIADPELAGKLGSGKEADITPCVFCNNCLARDRDCTVNPAKGRERDYEIRPAARPKKVVVIGGGPAGMEAARVAALRGHAVTLYEKGNQLGGQLMLASLLKAEYWPLVKYYRRQLEKLGVTVRLKQQVDAATISKLAPDAIVMATGATSGNPDIKGLSGVDVLSSGDMQELKGGGNKGARRILWGLGGRLLKGRLGFQLMRRALRVWAPFGGRIVVIGSGLGGIEMADFLSRRGKQVTVIDSSPGPAFDTPPMPLLRQILRERLAARGVPILTEAKYIEVKNRALVVERHEEVSSLPVDTIVFTGDSRPNTEPATALRGTAEEFHLVGDCSNPCGILEAIHDGARIGRSL